MVSALGCREYAKACDSRTAPLNELLPGFEKRRVEQLRDRIRMMIAFPFQRPFDYQYFTEAGPSRYLHCGHRRITFLKGMPPTTWPFRNAVEKYSSKRWDSDDREGRMIRGMY